jgi:hypothetical protein
MNVILAQNSLKSPVRAIYLFDKSENSAMLSAATGAEPGSHLLPHRLCQSESEPSWIPLAKLARGEVCDIGLRPASSRRRSACKAKATAKERVGNHWDAGAQFSWLERLHVTQGARWISMHSRWPLEPVASGAASTRTNSCTSHLPRRWMRRIARRVLRLIY